MPLQVIAFLWDKGPIMSSTNIGELLTQATALILTILVLQEVSKTIC